MVPLLYLYLRAVTHQVDQTQQHLQQQQQQQRQQQQQQQHLQQVSDDECWGVRTRCVIVILPEDYHLWESPLNIANNGITKKPMQMLTLDISWVVGNIMIKQYYHDTCICWEEDDGDQGNYSSENNSDSRNNWGRCSDVVGQCEGFHW